MTDQTTPESWTPERVGKLIELWSAGLSGSQCAAELGGISRNAVIGKVTRLGINQRDKVMSLRSARKPKVEKPPAPVVAPPPMVCEPLPDPMGLIGNGETLDGLRISSCRWPHGDPLSEDFRFCGAKTARMGVPYCGKHMALAYQPRSAYKGWDRSLFRGVQ